MKKIQNPIISRAGAHEYRIDAHGLAVHGATAFMRQVMLYGRYHADLHPSNLFVTPDNRIAFLLDQREEAKLNKRKLVGTLLLYFLIGNSLKLPTYCLLPSWICFYRT